MKLDQTGKPWKCTCIDGKAVTPSEKVRNKEEKPYEDNNYKTGNS